MVALISQSSLTSLNVDTVERALVLSALALRLAIAASGNPDELVDKVKIATVKVGASDLSLKLDLLLPLDADIFSDKGGLVLQGTKELPTSLTILTGKLNFTTTPSSPNTPTIPPHDTAVVDTFEKYFMFYALILMASLPNNRNEVIEITPKMNNFDGAEIKVRVTLPLDVVKWASGSNFIDSVNRIATNYVTNLNFTPVVTTSSNLGNNSSMGNNSTMGN